MTKLKEVGEMTDRELMEKLVDNTRKSSDAIIQIKKYLIMLIGFLIIVFAFGLVYLQHD